MKKSLLSFLTLSVFLLASLASAEELSYSGSKSYSLTERTNLRKFENGKYVGTTAREVHSFISPASAYESVPKYAKDTWFDGNFYIIEERKNNLTNKTDGIYDSIPSIFHIAPDGTLTMYEDNGFPSFRSFPAFPTKKLNFGDTWTAQAERAVDPKEDGTITRLKIEVRYTLDSETVYQGEPVYKIKALWQTLYGMSWSDKNGDPNLSKALGGHKADIIVSKATGAPLLIIDNVDETFIYRDNSQIGYKGTITLFTKYPPAIDSDGIITALEEIATVKPHPKGLGGGSTGSLTTVKEGGGDSEKSGDPKIGDSDSSTKGGISDKTNPSGKDNRPGKDASTDDGSSGTDKSGGTVNSSEKNTSKKGETRPENGVSNGGGKGVSSETGGNSADKSKTGKNSSASGKKNSEKNVGAGKNSDASTDAKNGMSKWEKLAEDKAFEVETTAAKNDMIVETTNAGIRLTIQNLQFQPDSSELILGTEGNRLDEIAKVLKMAPDSQILIEGHTAAVGKPAGELSLSQERARKIANELSKRGIPSKNIIVRGWGGNKPLAPNTTNAGRALNRRVEITILQ